jgi:large subunit ribosomal protein L6
MSRIGGKPVTIPSGVQVSIADGPVIHVKGPRGQLSKSFPGRDLSFEVVQGSVVVKRRGDENDVKALHGLARSEISNMVDGVVKGFERKLEVSGVGYKIQVQGRRLSLVLGFSHPIVMEIPQGLEVTVDKQTAMTVRGADKGLVGQFAANIRGLKPPEPYQGKGVKYQGEHILRKEGKKSK